MNTYDEWAARYPDAAIDLQHMLGALPWPTGSDDKPEAWAQQQARFQIAQQGAMAWRNNVGATPAKSTHQCPFCQHKFQEQQQPIRYGLANDSAKLNAVIKSADLILAIPRLITHDMVGTTIAQFGSVETKRPGWVFTGKNQEAGQMAWATLVKKIGGFACFSTGDVKL